MVRDVPDRHFGTVLQAGVVPHVPEAPGVVRWTGPDLGEHSRDILKEVLGMEDGEIEKLAEEGVL